MAKALFITGTDTEIGKTHVACALVRAARDSGLRVAVFKPVAAGCEVTPEGLRNADALDLMHAAGGTHDYDLVNPYAFQEPVAPHLAAADAGVDIDLDRIMDCYRALAKHADLVVVEGAGGWTVPLGADLAFPDLVEHARWPVLLVVGMRLGCLNHALLSAESIARRAQLLGWIANCLPPAQPRLQENIASLEARLLVPLLGTVVGERTEHQGLRFSEIYQSL